jgi:hypothetical protein
MSSSRRIEAKVYMLADMQLLGLVAPCQLGLERYSASGNADAVIALNGWARLDEKHGGGTEPGCLSDLSALRNPSGST